MSNTVICNYIKIVMGNFQTKTKQETALLCTNANIYYNVCTDGQNVLSTM